MYSNTYVNSYRKQFYALNVQVIGDGQLLIRDLQTSTEIVRATGVLHNLAVILKDPLPDSAGHNDSAENHENLEEDHAVNEAATRAQGTARRENILRQFTASNS